MIFLLVEHLGNSISQEAKYSCDITARPQLSICWAKHLHIFALVKLRLWPFCGIKNPIYEYIMFSTNSPKSVFQCLVITFELLSKAHRMHSPHTVTWLPAMPLVIIKLGGLSRRRGLHRMVILVSRAMFLGSRNRMAPFIFFLTWPWFDGTWLD